MPKSRSRKQNQAAAAVAATDAPLETTLPADVEISAAERAPDALPVVAPWLTLEAAAYIALGVCAVLLRVMNLDARPLAPDEAKTAAAAWAFLQSQPVGEFSSPLLFTLNWVAFLLFGAFDVTARLLPAAASALIVFIPLLARNTFGRTGALTAALLLTLSPTLVFFGRHLGASDAAVGGMVAALILFWNFRASQNARGLYLGAILAALALTADATAFPILVGGAGYFTFAFLRTRRERAAAESAAEMVELKWWRKPYARAAFLFAATYLLAATTFLLNRDGMGAAFNLLGAWLSALSSLGAFTTPLNYVLAYEPLALLFGLAGAVLALSYRGAKTPELDILRMLAVSAMFAFVWYLLGAQTRPADVVAITLPLILLAGWFIGNLLERAHAEIRASGGASSALSGELPVLLLLLLLTVLLYFQVGAFLQQARFSPALDAFFRQLGGVDATSLGPALATLGLLAIFLLAIFVGLSMALVGVGRTLTLLALALCALLLLGQLRALWLLNFDTTEPLREIIAATQTPQHLRTLVHDLEWYSQNRQGDAHVMRIAADQELGAVGRWYLRDFVNVTWTNQIERAADAQAIVSPADAPPPGDWMGQRYRVRTEWTLGDARGFDVWKWYVFRQGGSESAQTTMLWLPTLK